MRKFNQLLINLHRILIWIPVIWRDRNWDQTFLLKIMEFKLRQMAEYFEKRGVSVNNKEQAKKCLRTAVAIHRMEEENYMDGWCEWIQTGPDFLDGHFNTGIGLFANENSLKHENYMYEQDLDYVAKMFKKHLRGWWD